MTDHLPECQMKQDCGELDARHTSETACQDCGRSCSCSALRACEQRLRDAHIAILESARPSGKCDCDWCAEHDWLISDLIHALKEKP